MSFDYSNGTKQGIAQILAAINSGQNSGSSPLAGLLGANKLAGGVQLNPDGTVGSVSPVTVPHNILDAIFNHGKSQAAANAQNAAMQQAALATTQGMTAQKQQNAAAAAMQQSQIAATQKQAVNQALMEYGKANNVTVLRPDGTLTDAGAAAQSTLDPARIQAITANLQRQQYIAQTPEVQDAEKKSVIAQANQPAVANAAASRMIIPQGGTGVTYNPDNPIQPTSVVIGGTPSSTSSSGPVIKNIHTAAGDYPMNVGEQSTSQSGVQPGGVQSFAIPANIQAVLNGGTNNPASTNNMVGDTYDPGDSEAEAELKAQQTAVPAQTPDASTSSFNTKGAIAGVTQLAQGLAALGQKKSVPVDNSASTNLLNQGAQQALNPTSTNSVPITGGMINPSGIATSADQLDTLNPQPFAAPATNSTPALQQLLQLLQKGGSSAVSGLNMLTRGYN